MIRTSRGFPLINITLDGVIRSREMREMYAEQLERMESLGHEVVPFEDVMCQMCDLLKPEVNGEFRVRDFVHWETIENAGVFFDMLFNFFTPEHFKVWFYHLVFLRQVQPYLKKLDWIFLVLMNEWKHFGVLHTFSSRHPLYIAIAISSSCS